MNNQEKKEIGKNTGKSLSKLYILALSAVAVLTIAGQVLIQRAISSQQSDSHVINLAGSQRYLSQQIVKFSILIHKDIEHQDYPAKAGQLLNYIHMWKKGHYGLQFGDKALNLPGDNSAVITRMFEEIDPFFEKIAESADSIVALAPVGASEHGRVGEYVQKILQNEDAFFQGMDRIVNQYDLEAKAKVAFLKKVEYVLVLATLIILLLEGLFIFRPAAKKIKETIRDLTESEDRSNQLAAKLKIANMNLQKSLKDLKDVNFAMDKATILAKTDRYGIITYVNHKFCQIMHYEASELVGQRFNLVSSHYHSKSFFDRMWEQISAGEVWNHEIQNKTREGTSVWLDATIVPVLDNQGVPESYIAIYSDVTARFRQSINEQKIRSSSLIDGQEKERKNIARELHDGLGQMLTALKFNFEGIKGGRSKSEQEKIAEIRKQISDTIQETRRISFNLMPSVLNDYGLLPAVKHLADQVAKYHQIEVSVESDWKSERLGRQIETNLYRIIQEALNNAVKYAEADQVFIAIDRLTDCLRLEITDNGKGFLVKEADRKKTAGSGNGITNIQERTDLINGEFQIKSAPGHGTRILIKVPCVVLV